MKTKFIAQVLVVIMLFVVVSCSNKTKDFEQVKTELKYVNIEYKAMPVFDKDMTNSQNFLAYGHYIDSLILPLSGGMPAYYALVFNDSMSQVIYVNEQVKDNANQLALFFDSPESICKRAISNQNGAIAMMQSEPLDNGYVSARIIGTDPRTFVSRDTWELLYYHELIHLFQDFNHSNKSVEARELEAYSKEIEFLESKNPEMFGLFIVCCDDFYKKYGFCKELMDLCTIAYHTEQLSFLERSMLEPTLMFAVAMKVHNIKKTDVKKMKGLLKDFNDYLSEIGAVKYGITQ